MENRILKKQKSQRWLDLQLPLYAWAIEEDYGAEVNLGYFNIPSVGANTGVSLLTPFDAGIMALAMDCARGVVNDVSNARFWPPATKLKHDDYEAILFDQPESTAVKPGEMLA